MRIHIDQIKDDGLSLSLSEPAERFPVLSDLIQNSECVFLTPIEIRLRVTRVSDIINVDGELNTIIRLACDRCLSDFDHDLQATFSLAYSQNIDSPSDEAGEDIELTDDEAGLMPFSGEEIDFRGGIQEQVVLALPFRALCSDTCKGLCQQCGADLNEAKCTCSKVMPAGKFEALRKLKLEDD